MFIFVWMSMVDRMQRRQPGRQIIIAAISVIAILAAVAMLSKNVVTTMRDAANDIDANRSISAVTAAISSVKKRLVATVRDNAIWDDAYGAIGSNDTIGWIDSNWGSTSADYPLYDGVIVLGPDGNQIAAYLKGEAFDATSAFGPELAQQSRDASNDPSTTAQVNFFERAGQITMVATLAIQPYANKPNGTRFSTLTFFKDLTADYIAGVAEDFQVRGLSLSQQEKPGKLDYTLLSRSGVPLAHLNWPRINPGTAVYEQVFSKLMILAALFALLPIVVIIYSRKELKKENARAIVATHDATHDHLTGLLNRSGFIQAIASAPSDSLVHLIDLDGFKAVNDAWGHAVGDQLIRHVADKLRTINPQISVVARIGGDEFALIHSPRSMDAPRVGAKIIEILNEPFLIEGRTIEIGASIGFVERTADQRPLEVLRRADVALYHAKENGRGQVSAYTVELDHERENVADAELRLKQAIQNNEIQVYYQPLISSDDGNIVGIEALARWTPATGPVSPEIFIPLAERSGLIDALSGKVLETAIETASQWPTLELSVNVSPLQLCNPNFAGDIAKMLSAKRFDPSRLILEVTEGVFIAKPDRAKRSITALRKIGVRFAMDDFGTGHASIGTLRQFGFDKVKIDRSLIASGNEAIVRATIQLAAALDIPVTAEGIETEQQAELAKEAGCELLQGYLIGRPMPLEQLKRRMVLAQAPALSA